MNIPTNVQNNMMGLENLLENTTVSTGSIVSSEDSGKALTCNFNVKIIIVILN